MIVAITGTRSLNDTGRQNIHDCLSLLDPREDTVMVGGCKGADTFAALIATSFGLSVYLVLPSFDEKWMARWYDPDAITLQSVGWRAVFTTRERNEILVNASDQVWAFPEYPEDHRRSRRSGTWMTCRMAKRAKKLAVCLTQHGNVAPTP